MEVLELEPLKDKRLTVLLVEKEYNEPFWLVEPPSGREHINALHRPSIAFYEFIKRLIRKVKPDFVTDELGMRNLDEFMHSDLQMLLSTHKIPLYPVEIDENARAYIAQSLMELKEERDEVIRQINILSKREEDEKLKMNLEYLVAYGQYLQKELEEEERKIKYSVRPSWIVKGIMDHAKNIDSNELTCIHLCSPELMDAVAGLLESLNVETHLVSLTKDVSPLYAKGRGARKLFPMNIRVKPTIKYPVASPRILVFLSTDETSSPFDICMAYDAGFDIVIPYSGVTAEKARSLVRDAMFSRTPKTIKRTCFYIGGKDLEKAEEILKVVKETMFPPFTTSIIIDPGGAYTTAASIVAKVEHALKKHRLGELGGKTCAVFGTGPVGRTIAILLQKLGCEVLLVEPNPKLNREYVEHVARKLCGMKAAIEGIHAPDEESRLNVLRRADVIFLALAPGVQVITREMLEKLKSIKVFADLNASPPLGVEGLKLNDDMREILPMVYGIGALTIGKLKYRVEMSMLKEAGRAGKGVYDYTYAMELARKLLLSEELVPAFTITTEQ